MRFRFWLFSFVLLALLFALLVAPALAAALGLGVSYTVSPDCSVLDLSVYESGAVVKPDVSGAVLFESLDPALPTDVLDLTGLVCDGSGSALDLCDGVANLFHLPISDPADGASFRMSVYSYGSNPAFPSLVGDCNPGPGECVLLESFPLCSGSGAQVITVPFIDVPLVSVALGAVVTLVGIRLVAWAWSLLPLT